MEALRLKTENILELTDGDTDYLHELVALYLDFLKEFPINYRETIEKNDLVEFKLLIHKAKPSLTFLGITSIQQEVQTIKEALVQQNIKQNQIAASIKKIEQACKFFREELLRFEAQA